MCCSSAWVSKIVSKHISLEAAFTYFGRMHQNRLVILKLLVGAAGGG